MTLKDCDAPEFFLIGQITAEARHPDQDSIRNIAIALRDYYADRSRRHIESGPMNADLAKYSAADAEAMNQTIQRLTKGAQ